MNNSTGSNNHLRSIDRFKSMIIQNNRSKVVMTQPPPLCHLRVTWINLRPVYFIQSGGQVVFCLLSVFFLFFLGGAFVFLFVIYCLFFLVFSFFAFFCLLCLFCLFCLFLFFCPFCLFFCLVARMQSECSQNVVRMQLECSQNVVHLSSLEVDLDQENVMARGPTQNNQFQTGQNRVRIVSQDIPL